MGRYTVSLEEYLDHILRKAHVHFTFDVLVRYGVVVVVCADMVVILYGGYFPGRREPLWGQTYTFDIFAYCTQLTQITQHESHGGSPTQGSLGQVYCSCDDESRR